MLTDYSLKNLQMVIGSAANEKAITVTTTDDSAAVSINMDIDQSTLLSADITELKSLADQLVALHQTLAGIS
jgi:hypothetical protein